MTCCGEREGIGHPWEGRENDLPNNNDRMRREKELHGHNDEKYRKEIRSFFS